MPTKLPRLNVTVTEEQHRLLLEMAALDGGSAAGFLRSLLDQVTPLLRATVPAMRMAAEEMDNARTESRAAIEQLMAALEEQASRGQPDLVDTVNKSARPPRGRDRSARQGARTGQKRRTAK